MDKLKYGLIIAALIGVVSIATATDFPRVTEDISTGKLRYTINGIYINANQCGELSRAVLQNLSDDSIAGVFTWSKMHDRIYRDRKFRNECNRLQYEMNRLKEINIINETNKTESISQ
jgi:hypothetical protein